MYDTPEGRGERELRSGLRALREHRPDRALSHLRLAADHCPATSPAALENRLYWLAVALLRLDRPELAMKSLATAQKLRPRGLSRSLYLRLSNEYGMPRRARAELDDFYAFYSIQISAYFSRKGRACFDDFAEKDIVVRLIGDAWMTLSRSGRLRGLASSEKLRLFRSKRVTFPDFACSQGIPAVIPADFHWSSRAAGEERCSCGSGLPYRRCCGRTASPGELLRG